MVRTLVACLLVLLALTAPTRAQAAEPLELVGSLHEHSGYSDGWPGSTPRDYFAAGRANGLDFLGSSEHSDNMDVPLVLSEECADLAALGSCLNADPVTPADAMRKWAATQEQADAARTPTYTPFRGFEWTSDRFGHINVFFSRKYTNAKLDGGYATLRTFYRWLAGHGRDGVATFNHPGAKELADGDPAADWNDFRYEPKVDRQMVGIEVFNDRDEFGRDWYARALDKGWHVGAVGAEDLGHRRSDDWAGPSWPKTVVLADGRTPAAIRAAMLERRFYAIRRTGIRLTYTLDGAPMGTRRRAAPGAPLRARATVAGVGQPRLELVTAGGRVVASAAGASLDATVAAAREEPYYFVRALDAAGEPVAYSSPVWTTVRRSWVAGDLHVHTCYSHDAVCFGTDENPPLEELYTLGLDVPSRFAEASARGLDYLALTDHNDLRSAADPGFGAGGVIALPGYENSLDGHAQMLGARSVYDPGAKSADDVRRLAAAVRADGGLFQINHPANGATAPFDGCDRTDVLDWGYGYEVQPDTIEVLNPTALAVPAEAYWECWLDRGARVGATGGSDSHWAATTAVQGSGHPTTWALTRSRERDAILAALREGRTTISKLPPALGGARLVLEADGDGDGGFEAAIGDTVAPGARMRARLEGGVGAGLLRVRANGRTLVEDRLLAPGQSVVFRAPSDAGWVRASLHAAPVSATRDAPGCAPADQPISTCAYDVALLALTSPIYLR